MAGLCTPLPTLHLWPRDQRCTARGRCGSLFLHRIGLSPPTPCRPPGAHLLICLRMDAPSHGRGRRFNPYSAHHENPLKSKSFTPRRCRHIRQLDTERHANTTRRRGQNRCNLFPFCPPLQPPRRRRGHVARAPVDCLRAIPDRWPDQTVRT